MSLLKNTKPVVVQNIFNFILIIWLVSIPFKNVIYQISTVLLIAFFLIYLVKYKDFTYLKNLLLNYKELIYIFFMILLSLIISDIANYELIDTNILQLQISYFYRYIFIFVILLYFYSKNFFTKSLLYFIVLISLSIQTFDGLYQSIVGYDLFKNNVGSLESGLTAATFNRNTFGLIMGLGVLLSFFLINREKVFNKTNLLNILLFIFFIFCSLFSYSRATWVALFLSFILYFIIHYKNIKLKYILYFIISLFIFIFIFLNIDPLFSRLNLLLSGYLSNRDEIWLNCVDLIKQKPFFGWGVGTWSEIGLKAYSSVHNSILEILLYLGFFGLFIYLYFFIVIIKELFCFKNFKAYSILIYFIVVSFFDQDIFSGKIFLSFFTILIFYIFSNRLKISK